MAANAVRVGAPGAPPREAPAPRRWRARASRGSSASCRWRCSARCSGARCSRPTARRPDAARRGRGGRRGAACCSRRARPAPRRARRAARSAASLGRARARRLLERRRAACGCSWPAQLGRAARRHRPGHPVAAGVTVPYRGVDEWVRIALLAAAARCWPASPALIAFWPRPRARTPGRSRRRGRARRALRDPDRRARPDARRTCAGAVFCSCSARSCGSSACGPARIGAAVACLLALATVAGVLVAPRLDGRRRGSTTSSIADDLQPERAATFNWDHSYGPLDWPRDGREVLRSRPRTDVLEGGQPRRVRRRCAGRLGPDPHAADESAESTDREWLADDHASSSRGIRSRAVHRRRPHGLRSCRAARDAVSVEPRAPSRPAASRSRRGESYQARSTCRARTTAQLRTAGTRYPDLAALRRRSSDHRACRRAARAPARVALRFRAVRLGAARPTPRSPTAPSPTAAATAPARTRPTPALYALAQRLAARAEHAVRVRRSGAPAGRSTAATLQRAPAARARPARWTSCSATGRLLPAVLGRHGAAAAHGRRPGARRLGLHARAATTRKRDEYVVRDDDAHSWVEAYFPGIGWVTFDPTPSASPARSQISDVGPAQPPRRRGRASAAARPATGRPSRATRARGSRSGRSAAGAVRPARRRSSPLLAALAPLVVVVAAPARRRRGRPAGARARRAAAGAAPQRARRRRRAMTLPALEQTLGGSDAARRLPARAARAALRGRADAARRAAQRAPCGASSAPGLGFAGRLRAWWALPPLSGRRGPYTG